MIEEILDTIIEQLPESLAMLKIPFACQPTQSMLYASESFEMLFQARH